MFAEKFKLVVCGFGLEGEEEFGVEVEEEEEGNRRRWLYDINVNRLYMFL